MKLRFSAPALLVALYANGTSASLPSQLRRNVQEVADVPSEAGQMITLDAVELVMGDECVMMCETMKCHQHCSSTCSHESKKVASSKKKYCEVYGPDAPPLAPEVPGRLHLGHKHHAHQLDHHKKHYHVCSEMNPCDECQGDCNTGEIMPRARAMYICAFSSIHLTIADILIYHC